MGSEDPDSESTGWMGLGLCLYVKNRAGKTCAGGWEMCRLITMAMSGTGAQSCFCPQGPQGGREFWRNIAPQGPGWLRLLKSPDPLGLRAEPQALSSGLL